VYYELVGAACQSKGFHSPYLLDRVCTRRKVRALIQGIDHRLIAKIIFQFEDLLFCKNSHKQINLILIKRRILVSFGCDIVSTIDELHEKIAPNLSQDGLKDDVLSLVGLKQYLVLCE